MQGHGTMADALCQVGHGTMADELCQVEDHTFYNFY